MASSAMNNEVRSPGNCCRWAAVDLEFVLQHVDDSDETREAVHVLTTWHAGESPDDVAFFFVLNTNFDDHDFEHFLVLHVGDGPMREQVDSAVRRYAIVAGGLPICDLWRAEL